MTATAATFDFTNDDELPDDLPLTGSRTPVSYGIDGGIIGRPVKSMEKKQIRQRARRKMNVALDEVAQLYDKPLSEWDMEELARGRPRAADGTWKGKPPRYMDRLLHEQIVRKFEEIVREDMNAHTVSALKIIGQILEDEEVDDKGKLRIAAGTKLDAAKFLIEHVIGKPKQRMETDISVKLQGILGHAMVNPTLEGGFAPTQGYIEAKTWEEDDELPTARD